MNETPANYRFSKRFHSPKSLFLFAVQSLQRALLAYLICFSSEIVAQQYAWRTLAGAMPGGADGPGDQAQFYFPSGITSDADGNLYVADDLNNTVRKVLPNGTVRPPHTPSPLHVQGQLGPHPSKAIS